MWKFVEKVKEHAWPKSTRRFVRMPTELEFKEVPNNIAAIQDDRIMADGRPAHAWWCEIEMLRAREPELQKREAAIREQFRVLRIAEWAFMQDIITDEVILRIKRLPLTMASDPERELLEHPEKFCSV